MTVDGADRGSAYCRAQVPDLLARDLGHRPDLGLRYIYVSTHAGPGTHIVPECP